MSDECLLGIYFSADSIESIMKRNTNRTNKTDVTKSLSDTYDENSETTAIDRRTFLIGGGVSVGALLTGVGAAHRERSADPAQVSAATGSNGIVSTSHPLATEIGAQILEDGGNAVDAAIAIQFGLGVVEPHATGLGGGGFMVVHTADEGNTYVGNGQVRAPRTALPDRFVDTGSDITESGLAVGAPGILGLLETTLDRWGTVDLAALVEPAVALAERGIEVHTELARAIDLYFGRLTSDTREIFSRNGEPLEQGDILAQPALGETLQTIGEKGSDAFYDGAIAEDIVATVQAHDGDLTVGDLAAYEATIDEPVEGEFNDARIVAGSPPSGGVTLLQLLRLVDAYDLSSCRCAPVVAWNLFLEASHLAHADNWAYLGDNTDVPVDTLLSDEYLDTRRELITSGEANPNIGPGDPGAVEVQDDAIDGEQLPPGLERTTTHFTVADTAGNVVSMTTTNSLFFGTGITVPDRGIILANSLTNFDFEPGGPNQVEPTKRPKSTMSPAIVFRNGDPLMTAGSPGGASIISTTAQVIMNVLEYEMDLAAAVAQPRLFSSSYPTISWENGVSQEIRDGLTTLGYSVADKPTNLGNVQALYVDDDQYIGVADPRQDGLAVGLPR